MKRRKNLQLLMTSLICGSLLAGSQVGSAEELVPTFQLDEIVVTATRTLKQIQEVPASISVVTAKDIKEKNVTTVRDAIAQMPGVYMDMAGNSGITLRGFSSTDILVLVDGQQMNSTYNSVVNFNEIPVENVERIEVLRGAASSIYGGHAVGGVINITTKEARDNGLHGDAALSYGSHKTWKKALYLNGKANDKISFGAGYENRSSDGFRGFYRTAKGSKSGKAAYNATLPEMSGGYYVYGGRGEKDWKQESYNAHIKYNFDDSKSLKYIYTKSKSRYNYHDPFSYVYDKNGNQVFSGNVKTQNGDIITLSTSEFYGYLGESEKDRHNLTYKDEKNHFTTLLGYSEDNYNGFTSPNLPKSYKKTDWTGAGDYSSHPEKIYNLDVTKAWENVGGKHTILTGFSFKQEEMNQERYNLSAWRDRKSKTSMYAIDQGKVKNLALYLQDEFKISEPFTLYAGVRYDHFKKGAGKFWWDSKYDYSSEGKSYNEISPKLALSYKADDTTNFYISYGHSFNPPPLYNIYRYGGAGMGNVIPNPALDPETSNTFELGVKKQFGKTTELSVNLYQIKTKDKVAYTYFKGVDPKDKKYKTLYKQYINYGREKRRGVEFDVQHQFNKNFSGYFNWAWQSGRLDGAKLPDTNKDGYNNEPNYDLPKHLLHAGLQYKQNKFNALLDCEYVSARMAPEDPGGEYGAEDAFFLVNTALNYDINKDCSIQFAVNNLFDRKFYCDEATDGRTYTLSMRYHF